MKILVSWITSSLVVLVVSSVISGITIETFVTALWVSVAMGVVNALIRPLLILITLPINVLTLGLFTLVINASLVLLVASLVAGFTVDSFWSALLFSVGVSLTNWLVSVLFDK